MDKIHWGIIGCGDVTEIKSGPAFNKVANSSLVAVMRRDAAKAADYARRHAVPFWYSDAQQLIDAREVNAIYIATPPQYHEIYTIRALRAGKPVYVEKPMALDSISAKSMWQASIETGTRLSVAHYRDAQPRFTKVKALLDANEIGTVRMINLQLIQAPPAAAINGASDYWRVDPAISGGGLFHDLSPHQLHLLQYLFGEVECANGFSLNQSGRYAADDLVMGTVHFKNGPVLNGSWCFSASAAQAKDSVEIIGSLGSISFSTFGANSITICKNGEEHTLQFEELPHVQQPMIEAVVKYFLGEGANPSTAESGVMTMRIIDAFTKKNIDFL